MKVRIAFTVEVDPQEWASEYGVALEDVREDVQRYLEGAVYDCAAWAAGFLRHAKGAR